MGLQQFLKTAFAASLGTFDAEEVRIGTEPPFMATADERRSNDPLGVGATKGERNLTIQFPSSSFPGKLKSGMKVRARGEDWQISAEPDAIRKGFAATTLELVEPERRREF